MIGIVRKKSIRFNLSVLNERSSVEKTDLAPNGNYDRFEWYGLPLISK